MKKRGVDINEKMFIADQDEINILMNIFGSRYYISGYIPTNKRQEEKSVELPDCPLSTWH